MAENEPVVCTLQDALLLGSPHGSRHVPRGRDDQKTPESDIDQPMRARGRVALDPAPRVEIADGKVLLQSHHSDALSFLTFLFLGTSGSWLHRAPCQSYASADGTGRARCKCYTYRFACLLTHLRAAC